MNVGGIGVALLLVSVLPAATALAGDWTGHNVTDHLRGVVGVGARAKGTLEDNTNRSRPGEVVVNCAQNSTTVYVGGTGFYFGSDSVAVEYTLNGGPVQRARWNVCAASDCVGMWNGAGIPFIKSLFDKALLRISIARRFAEPVNGTFAIVGAAEGLEPVGRACGWLSTPPAKK
jgi:hypothetical protein